MLKEGLLTPKEATIKETESNLPHTKGILRGDYFIFASNQTVHGEPKRTTPRVYLAIDLHTERPEVRDLFCRLRNACFMNGNLFLVSTFYRWIRQMLFSVPGVNEPGSLQANMMIEFEHQFWIEFGWEKEIHGDRMVDPRPFNLELETLGLDVALTMLEQDEPMLRAWRRDNKFVHQDAFQRLRGYGYYRFMDADPNSLMSAFLATSDSLRGPGYEGQPEHVWQAYLNKAYEQQIRDALIKVGEL